MNQRSGLLRMGALGDARARFEADAELLFDAVEQNEDHGIDRELFGQVRERFRRSLAQLRKLERAAGIEVTCHPEDLGVVRRLADLIAESVRAPQPADGADPLAFPCPTCSVEVTPFDTECTNGHGVLP